LTYEHAILAVEHTLLRTIKWFSTNIDKIALKI
jgi:hypothetical protein